MGNFYIDNPDGGDYGPHYRQASIFWDFDFHTIDFEIGRNYTIGTNLELRPFLGLKAAIIDQTVQSNWRNPIDMRQRTCHSCLPFQFRNRGFEFGILGNRSLARRDDNNAPVLQGSLQPQALWDSIGRDHVRTLDMQRTVQQRQPEQSVTIDTSPITSAATMLRGVIGFEWEQRFSRATSSVRLGYEAQFWLNQMQFYSYNIGRLNNVTSLQGGFVEWQLNF